LVAIIIPHFALRNLYFQSIYACADWFDFLFRAKMSKRGKWTVYLCASFLEERVFGRANAIFDDLSVHF
jgi:hypothetical protein